MAAPIQAAIELVEAGKLDQAAATLTRYLQRQPADGQANNAMAVVAAKQGRFDQAEFFARRAIAGSPDDAVFHETLAHALASVERYPEAVAALERAVALQPTHLMFHLGLASMLWDSGRIEAAMARSWEALRISGNSPTVAAIHISLMQNLGQCEQAAGLARHWLQSFPGDHDLLQALILTLNYLPGQDPVEVLQLHRQCSAPLSAVPGTPHPPRLKGRKLRVGYLSPDFRRHSVTYFAEPILAGHDRARFDVYCYFTAGKPDAVTRRLQALPLTWRECRSLSDEAIADRIASDGIDILVELSGHTSGNRLGVMARRPAPIQVSAIGYPNTTGMPAIGCRIVDAITDPPEADRWHSEALIRLPGCFLCYRPDDEAPDPSPPPCLARGSVTFGSFNNCAKLSDATIKTWARVLDAVPGSRLLVKATLLRDPWVRSMYEQRFAAAGAGPDRVTILPPVMDKAGHLAAYAEVDIALDPFPYNGTTTTCEALWMGVPVVTLEGRVHAGRVGMSLLRRAGLSNLIARNEDEYVSLAATLASGAARLGSLRGTLRRTLAETLCDPKPVLAGLENAYQDMARGAGLT